MGLLRLLLELEVLLPIFLFVEIGLPVLRSRQKFPVVRWVFRRFAGLLPRRTSSDVLLEASQARYQAARRRLEARLWEILPSYKVVLL